MNKPSLFNGLTLAYLGDAAYELQIRKHLIEKGMTKPNQLHHTATQYVSAKAQAGIAAGMHEAGLLSEEEETIFKRGRNAKSHTKAKYADHQTYSASTGFEAMIGYVYLSGNLKRFDALCQWAVDYIEEIKND
ncbi:MAG: Mini-ribonuclease 3 [Atopococcus tabaci]|uniref:Mini-ribonuclease 3 n=1 Tax=Atopococcus tabaci TaxID=269774 RepID=A0AA43ZRX2_9LACT|nr:Mini-ribonuclease 3 [Atopococcus tabaci]